MAEIIRLNGIDLNALSSESDVCTRGDLVHYLKSQGVRIRTVR